MVWCLTKKVIYDRGFVFAFTLALLAVFTRKEYLVSAIGFCMEKHFLVVPSLSFIRNMSV